jgi:hypothetical protein
LLGNWIDFLKKARSRYKNGMKREQGGTGMKGEGEGRREEERQKRRMVKEGLMIVGCSLV